MKIAQEKKKKEGTTDISDFLKKGAIIQNSHKHQRGNEKML